MFHISLVYVVHDNRIGIFQCRQCKEKHTMISSISWFTELITFNIMTWLNDNFTWMYKYSFNEREKRMPEVRRIGRGGRYKEWIFGTVLCVYVFFTFNLMICSKRKTKQNDEIVRVSEQASERETVELKLTIAFNWLFHLSFV